MLFPPSIPPPLPLSLPSFIFSFSFLPSALPSSLLSSPHRHIPNCSHWVQQDAPDLVNQFMREFLKN